MNKQPHFQRMGNIKLDILDIRFSVSYLYERTIQYSLQKLSSRATVEEGSYNI